MEIEHRSLKDKYLDNWERNERMDRDPKEGPLKTDDERMKRRAKRMRVFDESPYPIKRRSPPATRKASQWRQDVTKITRTEENGRAPNVTCPKLKRWWQLTKKFVVWWPIKRAARHCGIRDERGTLSTAAIFKMLVRRRVSHFWLHDYLDSVSFCLTSSFQS